MLGGSRRGPLLESPSGLCLALENLPHRGCSICMCWNLRGQTQEKEKGCRTPGMITVKGEPVAMLTRLGEKERRLC